MNEADRVWDELGLSDEIMDEWLNEPFKEKLKKC